jgi:hypothetical protein
MKTQLSITELKNQFQSAEFVLKTQRQIAKDFYASGIQFTAEFEVSSLDYTSICEHVGDKVNELMKLGETQFMQLLYQIDIPQQDFLALTEDPDFIPKMSELIIKREAYKVYLRSKY